MSMNTSNWGGKRNGSGRKATGHNTVNITLTLTISEAELLKERAKRENLSVSKFVAKYLMLDSLPENLTGGRRLAQ